MSFNSHEWEGPLDEIHKYMHEEATHFLETRHLFYKSFKYSHFCGIKGLPFFMKGGRIFWKIKNIFIPPPHFFHTHKCLQMIINTYKCLQMLINTYKCLQMLINTHKWLQMIIKAHKCLQMLINTHKWLQMLISTHKIVDKYL